MEVLLSANDSLWNKLYEFGQYAGITDRILFPILFLGVLTGILCVLFKNHIIMLLTSLSVNYGVFRVPAIHSKLSIALQNTVSVILRSPNYSADFRNATGIKKLSTEAVTQLLYRLPEGTVKERLLETSTAQLYSGYFHAEHRISSIGPICLTDSIPFWIFLIFIILFFFKIENKISLILVIGIGIAYMSLILNRATVGMWIYAGISICVECAAQYTIAFFQHKSNKNYTVETKRKEIFK